MNQKFDKSILEQYLPVKYQNKTFHWFTPTSLVQKMKYQTIKNIGDFISYYKNITKHVEL